MNVEFSSEQMIIHRFLQSFVKNDSQLNSSLTGIEKAESNLSLGTAVMSESHITGVNKNKMADGLSHLESAIERFVDKAKDFSQDWEDVEWLLTKIEKADKDAAKMLRLIYISGVTGSDAAQVYGCSRQQFYKLWKRGLDVGYQLLVDSDIEELRNERWNTDNF